MFRQPDPHSVPSCRAGASLLPVVATLFVIGLVVASLATTARGGARAARAAEARAASDALADATGEHVLATDLTAAMPTPGRWDTVPMPPAGDTARVAVVGRPTWGHLVVRLRVSLPAGVPGARAMVGRRLDLPLRADLAMPAAPLVGARPWHRDGTAVVALERDDPADRRCRDTVPAAPVPPTIVRALPPLAALLGHPRATPLDLETVAAPVDGVLTLPPAARIERPLTVTGVLVAAGDLAVAAPLTVRGLLLAGGSVETRTGGVLRLDGAAWSGDAGGGTSRTGPADTVRWDPCLVRAALDRLARLAPHARWRSVHAP